MKRLSIFMALMILVSNIDLLISQPLNYSGWFFENPQPTSNSLYSIRFLDNNTGFAAGTYNNIVKTTNGGINWTLNYDILNMSNNQGLNSIYFVNNSTGFTTGSMFINDYYTLKTTDCGSNWIGLQQGIGGKAISFPSQDTGYIVGNVGHIFKTTNCGNNWLEISNGNYGLLSVNFINNNTGYAAGSATGAIGKILKTTNGGISWDINTINNNDFEYIQFIDVYTGYVGGGDHLYKTIDGGTNWALMQCPFNGLTKAQFLDANIGYTLISGYINYIFKTTNGGNNWVACLSGYGPELESIYFLNKDTGYVCSADGNILYTINGGNNWVDQKYDVTEKGSFLQTVQFVNQITGYTADSQGSIYKTSNGGNNWFNIRNGTGPSFKAINDIHFLDQNTGFAVGDSLTIIRTTNAGINWLNLYVGPLDRFDFYSINFTDPTTAYITGSIGSTANIILKTTDLGNNWTAQNTDMGNGYLITTAFIDANTGFAAGSRWLFKTTNSGNNWNMYFDLASGCPACLFYKMVFTNSITGFLVGGDYGSGTGAIYRTTNAGSNWIKYTSFYGPCLLSVNFVNENTGYVCGEGGILMKTTNSGTNWNYLFSAVRQDLSGITFTDINTGYLVGSNGTILKTTTGGGNIIGVTPVTNQVPEEFILQQNYPNPFNPITVIRFQVAGYRFVKLAVYDLLGRELAVLVNQPLQPGTYEYEWDGSNYASGIYFYRLTSGDFTQTKKMVLIK